MVFTDPERLGLGFVLFILCLFAPWSADARLVHDSASAKASTKVITSIAAVKQRDIAFAPAFPGSPYVTISPNDFQHAAKMKLRGVSNAACVIALPRSVSLVSTDRNFEEYIIEVGNFTSWPPPGTEALGPDGGLTPYVGATRDRVRHRQLPGTYEGTFTVTFTFQ